MTDLIDTHQHLIYPDISGYAWTDGIPPLANTPFTVDDYNALTANHRVAGSLFMEAGVNDADYQTETRFVAELAGKPENKILGLIASCRPETNDGFEAWLEECGRLSVVGYRRILHEIDDDLSQTDHFRQNIRRIGASGQVFDMCFLARQLPIAYDLARACDNTQLVLDHCGVPDIAGGDIDTWRTSMRALATLPNVVCKLSGIMAYCTPGQASYAAISPYVEHVLETFGANRLVWGSDWPVVNLANGLPDWLDVTNRILSGLSEDEARAIGSQNARRVYGF